jgi:alpha-glucoside transport system permease protein
MGVVLTDPGEAQQPAGEPRAARAGVGARVHGALGAVPTFVLWLLVALWSVPTLGVLISSFRKEEAVRRTGWWESATDPQLTLENYREVFSSSGSDLNMGQHFLNSAIITIPATVIPIALAAFAAYAFAWMDFKGRHWLFIGVVALLAVPFQMSLVPLLQLFVGGAHLTVFDETFTLVPNFELAGTTTAVWLTHVGFGLPLAVFLLHNYIASLPRDVFEAARIDGADHPTIFWRLVLPLSVPALSAFAIFQFLWVWNDFLVARTFLGSGGEGLQNAPMTVRLATVSGSYGFDWHLMTAAAFVSIAVPLVVFFALQRYFVRGLLAGSVKG